ncbi:hypothetical protein MDA_GLEAN10011285 [Myotis davidii]|uniref:Uncharacterized protein n=1 Tax=Myotis davidii TaxID=225400 RepID=L5MEB4_MYODS|nr:hypothetical protein MDA_GLEAN10011285 [Myotis davidii]
MNRCTLKGTVGCEPPGHRGGSRSIFCAPAQPLLPRPLLPYLRQTRSHHHRTHVLTVLALLTPTDGTERLGLEPAAGVSGGCCPDGPSGAGGGGETLMDHRGEQLLLRPADGAKRSGRRRYQQQV